MANDLNRVMVIGRLGKDPEIRYTQSGTACASITVATSESWKDKQSGQKQEKTEWHNVSAFGKLAEIIGEYLKKGAQVYIGGKLQTRKWQDKNGNDRYTTEIIANEMQMLGGRGGEGSGQQQNQGQQNQGGVQQGGQSQGGGFDDFDDGSSIPF